MDIGDFKILDEDFKNYSTLESFKKKVAELKQIDFTNKSTDEIADIVFLYLDLFPSLVAKISIEEFNKLNFYRVRLNINKEVEDTNLIQTYSYPNPCFCKENGRANLKNKSVFYASNCAITSILESKPKVGDIGYLSIWKGRTTKEMKSGVLLPKDLRPENEFQALSVDIHSHFETVADEVAKEKSAYLKESLKFVSDLFLEEKPPYPITSLIADNLIYGKQWKDFIIYPSIARLAYTCNLAFHPNAVNNYLQFVKVIRFQVLRIGSELECSTGRVGEIINNNMVWRYAAEDEIRIDLLP